MEKVKNIIQMEKLNLTVNLKMEKNGMEKDMNNMIFKIIIWFMK